MSEQIIKQYEKFSFFKKSIFSFNVNKALKDCDNIEAYLLKRNYLAKSDSTLSLITSDGFTNQVDCSYFLYKGYNKDGSINPIRKYTILNGEIGECIKEIKQDIIVLDLYEESIYLHSYTKTNRSITGYLIKEKIKSGINKTLIFSNEKIKLNIKNINKIDTISVVDDFINSYIM